MTISDFDDEDKLLEPLGTIGKPGGQGAQKSLFTMVPGGAATLAIFVLVSVASFGLGMLTEHSLKEGSATGLAGASASSASSLTATGLTAGTAAGSATGVAPAGVVGSSDTKKYYMSWCPQVASIQTSKAVSFASVQAAASQGYTPGTDCPGM